MTPPKIKLALFVFAVLTGTLSLGAEDSVILKFAKGGNQATVQVLHDMRGKTYLPLMEVARFYGVNVQFDSQTRKVTLSKGKVRENLALSQSAFLTTDPDMSVPIDPVEVISGQLGIPPASVEDTFGTLLDNQVSYSPDQQSIVAGGVRADELRPATQARNLTAPTAVPATPTAVVVMQVTPTAVPTSEEAGTGEAQTEEKPEDEKHITRLEEEPPANKAMQARRIIIDAGHGGNDAGAPGRDHRYTEKQATLDIANKVAAYLKEMDPQLEVLMTRHADYYITLKYRTDFANTHNGDLFVSIHCNSNPREGAHGTEIYRYGAKASNKWAALAAERENGRHKDDTLDIMGNLRKEVYNRYSQKLAEITETRIEQRLGQHFRNIQRAPFYVLAHADMPAILVETAFISNQSEENKLKDPYWKDNMAKAIAEGILGYKDVVEGNSENEQARR